MADKVVNTHGGTREGAGRKRKFEKFGAPIADAESKIADNLPHTIDIIIKLANGDFVRVTETFEPAGLIMVDDTEIVHSQKGSIALKIKRQAFPELPPEQLVLVKRVVTPCAPDLNANQYLANRIMGCPTQRHEFANMSDEELIESATQLLGRDAEAGPDAAADALSE